MREKEALDQDLQAAASEVATLPSPSPQPLLPAACCGPSRTCESKEEGKASSG